MSLVPSEEPFFSATIVTNYNSVSHTYRMEDSQYRHIDPHDNDIPKPYRLAHFYFHYVHDIADYLDLCAGGGTCSLKGQSLQSIPALLASTSVTPAFVGRDGSLREGRGICSDMSPVRNAEVAPTVDWGVRYIANTGPEADIMNEPRQTRVSTMAARTTSIVSTVTFTSLHSVHAVVTATDAVTSFLTLCSTSISTSSTAKQSLESRGGGYNSSRGGYLNKSKEILLYGFRPSGTSSGPYISVELVGLPTGYRELLVY